ncbi:hypothetical protein AB0K00_26760 [Dactylosporangium sp. NPDC049525]|uniref:pPIWI-associating nuclease domain-containing protein n=1 Tax=Dactylosporangium sp. NPDC049525 TaxID=3154730 RepID=UPI003445F412
MYEDGGEVVGDETVVVGTPLAGDSRDSSTKSRRSSAKKKYDLPSTDGLDSARRVAASSASLSVGRDAQSAVANLVRVSGPTFSQSLMKTLGPSVSLFAQLAVTDLLRANGTSFSQSLMKAIGANASSFTQSAMVDLVRMGAPIISQGVIEAFRLSASRAIQPSFLHASSEHQDRISRMLAPGLTAALALQQRQLGGIVEPGYDVWRNNEQQLAGLVSAGLGQSLLRHQPGLVRLAESAGTVSASGLAIQNAYLASQMFELGRVDHLRLAPRVVQAAKSWSVGTRPTRLERDGADSESLLHLGFSAQSVNSAARVIEDEDSDDERPPWVLARIQETNLLLAWLEELDPKLPRKYKGAWHAVSQRGPDWISQAANSGVEALDWSLRSLAPPDRVLEWQASVGNYAKEIVNGKPTRALKVRFIAHDRGLPASSVDLMVKAVNGTLGDLQKLKHADDDRMAEAMTAALVALEHCLMMLWRGL